MLLRVRCSKNCAVGAFLGLRRKAARRHGFPPAKGPVLIGAGAAHLAANRSGSLRLKLTRRARRKLRGTVRVDLAVRATDENGTVTGVHRRYRLRTR